MAATSTLSIPGYLPQIIPVTARHDIYPGIDPKRHFENKSYGGKTVFITGASRGIGAEVSLFYARAGANLTLVSRDRDSLDKVKAKILEEIPGARIEIFAANVASSTEIARAVTHTINVFGKIDIAIPNAGQTRTYDKPFTEKDPDEWWNIVEVNLRGVYNVAHFTLPHLDKTEGYFVVTGSISANIRLAFSSQYGISKHALCRLVEFIKDEHPKVKTFNVHPGAVNTDMCLENPGWEAVLIDNPRLAAGTYLRLTSGDLDWLNGRYIEATWDLDEIEKTWKEKILEQDVLINKMSLPLGL